MVQINFAQKAVTVKIVYYGPGMSGKTTNLEVVHQRAPDSNRGDLTSIATDGDRTLFFDFMPLDLGTVAGMRTQFQIYTVPGQVYYNSTRKLVLQGVDGVIFVADSSGSMLQENLDSLRNLEENLAEYGKSLDNVPYVIQYNKRDLPDAMSVDELQQHLNPRGVPSFEAVANSGQGVFPTLKALAARVLDSIHAQRGGGKAPAARAETPVARPAAPTVAAPPVHEAATGFYSTPAPAANHPPQGPPSLAPAVQTAGTGFYPAPAAPAPTHAMPAASGAPGPMHAPLAPEAAPRHAAPPTHTHVHPAPAPVHAAPEGQHLRLAPVRHDMAAAPPYVQHGQPGMGGPGGPPPHAGLSPQQLMQPGAVRSAAPPPAHAPAPAPTRNVAGVPAAGTTRLKPRSAVLPTPKDTASGSKSTLVFVAVALAAGALMGLLVVRLL